MDRRPRRRQRRPRLPGEHGHLHFQREGARRDAGRRRPPGLRPRGVPHAINSRKVQVHLFDGYWEDIGTIGSFYEANLQLARPNPPFDLNDATAPIYTRPRFLPPSRIDGANDHRQPDRRRLHHRAGRDDREQRHRPALPHRPRRDDPQLGAHGQRLLRNARSDWPRATSPTCRRSASAPAASSTGAIVDKNCRIGPGVQIINHASVEDGQAGECCEIRDGILVVAKEARLCRRIGGYEPSVWAQRQPAAREIRTIGAAGVSCRPTARGDGVPDDWPNRRSLAILKVRGRSRLRLTHDRSVSRTLRVTSSLIVPGEFPCHASLLLRSHLSSAALRVVLVGPLVGRTAHGAGGRRGRRGRSTSTSPPVPPPVVVTPGKLAEKYEDGTVRIEREVLKMSDDQIVNHGEYTEYYPNGQKFAEGTTTTASTTARGASGTTTARCARR